ncbi:MAG: response regulator [Saprospiraceae bacterium]|nr:response regulator [Saprospiraceae bacterium]
MVLEQLNILLADDDKDDRFFFKMALDALTIPTQFTAVEDGEKLMEYLAGNAHQLPDVLFLDLNMPRKNGFECLSEIKRNADLKLLPVIIFSTSIEQEVVNRLYINGAQYFMRKPAEFSQLKNIIRHTVQLIMQGNISQPAKENFVLTIQNSLAI